MPDGGKFGMAPEPVKAGEISERVCIYANTLVWSEESMSYQDFSGRFDSEAELAEHIKLYDKPPLSMVLRVRRL
jgi:hypothetical protein